MLSLFTRDTEDLYSAGQRIIVGGPGPVERHDLCRLAQDGGELRLPLRAHRRGGRRKGLWTRGARSDRFLGDEWAAQQYRAVEEGLSFQGLCDVLSHALNQRFFLLCEGRALFSRDDKDAVGPLPVP